MITPGVTDAPAAPVENPGGMLRLHLKIRREEDLGSRSVKFGCNRAGLGFRHKCKRMRLHAASAEADCPPRFVFLVSLLRRRHELQSKIG